MKVIENAIVAEIVSNGTLIRWDEPHPTLGTSLWLAGWNRPNCVKVGDKGKLEYQSSSSMGLWWFIPYKG